MNTFKNWAKLIRLLSIYFYERNLIKSKQNSEQFTNLNKYFNKHSSKIYQNSSPIIQSGILNIQLTPQKQPKKQVIKLRLMSQNYEDKKKDDSQYTSSITDQEASATYINANNPRQEESAQQIFSQRIKKKYIRNNEINQIYFFKTNQNKQQIFNQEILDDVKQ
ncbi:hypothetical protein TTHERM_000886917 (macronuclear) [Tetrahymena thermophila SB210]|uniref:Uncharacterized protein n=1 Tax=Tetrahymena thermophila (strain SB210) TaxID=312017 RepID=W7XHC3_TETTS|nr:hypothetical protein TTHERM_000886917 [Tetrahymena thermophila SB210]EWS76613.1 hypothetical protein TTHERM_000886917 [Tetrahymena thermophila SB210]|eukprot:XP_012650899.1 hypothetical protein TTHERM_000886917 [Tetrahymena thermophila SB210]